MLRSTKDSIRSVLFPISCSLRSEKLFQYPAHGNFLQSRGGVGIGFGGNKYIDSKPEGPAELYTNVEKSYAEWKHVERVLPKLYIPEAPKDPSVRYSSGWKAPELPRLGAQYFIPRTRNHMIPVYLRICERDIQKRLTKIQKVEGNIWALEKDIGNHLKSKYHKNAIITWVNESWRTVFIHGDYNEDVKDWVIQQGF